MADLVKVLSLTVVGAVIVAVLVRPETGSNIGAILGGWAKVLSSVTGATTTTTNTGTVQTVGVPTSRL